jgi:acetyl esterase/lipase
MLRYGAVMRSLWSLRGEPSVAPVRPTEAAVPYRATRGLPAYRRGGIAPLADIYMPAASGAARAGGGARASDAAHASGGARASDAAHSHASGASVVVVHGGAFVIGSRAMKPIRYLAARLVDAGIAVCAIDYRMVFRGGRLAESVDDVVDALAFWSTGAAQRGLDPSAISLVGLSAGATLAWLAAARADAAPVHRLACCFGLYEMDHLRGPLASLLPRLLFATSDRAIWRQHCPRGVSPPPMPTLLLHGSDDGLVPVEQARRLAADREARGLPTRLVIYPGVPHGFFNMPGAAAETGAREIIEHVSR